MKSKSKYINIIIVLIMITFIGVIAVKYIGNSEKEKNTAVSGGIENNAEAEEGDNNEVEADAEERIETIEVMAVGDMLMHIDIVNAMYDWETGEYNFDYNFELIKNYLSKADITIANLETTLSGEESGYSGYPCFNTPDAFADAMKNAGIDVVSNMSNHSLDKGEYGFLRTRSVLKDKGFDIIGTRENEDAPRYIMKDIKGIKVGITAYGYTTDSYDGSRGLNGIPIPDELYNQMNTFNPYDVDGDFEMMRKDIEDMKADGADVIVFYMHWGEEYQLEPNESQIKIAQYLADNNVDIIFGDHPHTVQPIDILTSSDGNHTTDVIYSLGNFISSQRTESIGNPYTEDGLMVSVEITKNFKTGEITVAAPEFIPTWVKLNISNGYYYQVVPAGESDADYLDYSQSIRAEESFLRTSGIVESYNGSIEVWSGN